jgi:phage terminase small subunit
VENKLNYKLAEKDYIAGMKYKDIAAKYDVSINTVKSWKTRYNWSKKSVHTKNKKVCTQNKKVLSADKVISIPVSPTSEELELIDEISEELTEKQRLFCVYFINSFNATKAYRKAYGCTEYAAMSCGCRLLRNAKVKKEIDRLKQAKLNQLHFTQEDIFQRYLDIAYADIKDYVTFGAVKRDVEDSNGETISATYSYINFKSDAEVDGRLIKEISKGKDGAKIKLNDPMKALDWLAKHMNMATEEQKAKVEFLKAQADKLRSEDKVDTSSDEKMDNISKILEQMQGINANDIAD